MELSTQINKILYRAALVSIALLVVSILLNVWQFFTPKAIAATCNSFGSYSDILDSYHSGNKKLDGNGDGIPCNNRKP